MIPVVEMGPVVTGGCSVVAPSVDGELLTVEWTDADDDGNVDCGGSDDGTAVV